MVGSTQSIDFGSRDKKVELESLKELLSQHEEEKRHFVRTLRNVEYNISDVKRKMRLLEKEIEREKNRVLRSSLRESWIDDIISKTVKSSTGIVSSGLSISGASMSTMAGSNYCKIVVTGNGSIKVNEGGGIWANGKLVLGPGEEIQAPFEKVFYT